jgi:hypothetical protein
MVPVIEQKTMAIIWIRTVTDINLFG